MQLDELNGKYQHLRTELDAAYAAPVWDSQRINQIATEMIPVELALASLEYGRVEEKGIRCCYHGWLFDVQGHCLDQPCEPQGGRARDKARQPWYPVQELYGLLWTYMGPPEKKPMLPRYECLEQLEPGEFLEADDHSIGGGGPQVIRCNWL